MSLPDYGSNRRAFLGMFGVGPLALAETRHALPGRHAAGASPAPIPPAVEDAARRYAGLLDRHVELTALPFDDVSEEYERNREQLWEADQRFNEAMEAAGLAAVALDGRLVVAFTHGVGIVENDTGDSCGASVIELSHVAGLRGGVR